MRRPHARAGRRASDSPTSLRVWAIVTHTCTNVQYSAMFHACVGYACVGYCAWASS